LGSGWEVIVEGTGSMLLSLAAIELSPIFIDVGVLPKIDLTVTIFSLSKFAMTWHYLIF
jgi:hypothetical protein